jgi:hypothetical protein
VCCRWRCRVIFRGRWRGGCRASRSCSFELGKHLRNGCSSPLRLCVFRGRLRCCCSWLDSRRGRIRRRALGAAGVGGGWFASVVCRTFSRCCRGRSRGNNSGSCRWCHRGRCRGNSSGRCRAGARRGWRGVCRGGCRGGCRGRCRATRCSRSFELGKHLSNGRSSPLRLGILLLRHCHTRLLLARVALWKQTSSAMPVRACVHVCDLFGVRVCHTNRVATTPSELCPPRQGHVDERCTWRRKTCT